jgi:serine/threonine-protein kinase
VVRFGRFYFDRTNHILSAKDGEITLPPRVLAVLDLLVERAGSVVSKETLMGSVWKDAYVGDASLTEAMSLLRHALEDNPKDPTYIQTVHRRGYRFVAPVTIAGRVGAERDENGTRTLPQPEDQRGHTLKPRMVIYGAAAVVTASALIVILAALRPGKSDTPTPGAETIRLDVSSPQGVVLPFYTASALALSPDGDVLVFVGRDDDGETRLYRRRISEFDSHPIPGTEGAGSPFFSPDGNWVAFFTEGELRKTPLNGGAVIRVCASPFAFGGGWADDGTIVFTGSHASGLSTVSADGGEVGTLTTLRPSDGEVGHWWPQVLPGGRGVLYSIWSSSLPTSRIVVLDLETGENRTLINGASYPRYSSRGNIYYLTPGGMASVPFDAEGLVLSGAAEEMIDQPQSNRFVGVAHFAVSATGTLAYLPAGDQTKNCQLVRIDANGTEARLQLEPTLFRNLRVDPRAESVAVTILDGQRSDVWMTPLDSPNLSRLTFSGFNIEPRWSPDGKWVVFASNRDGPFNIYRKPSNGAGEAERIAASDNHQYPGAFSPDGRYLIFSQATPDSQFDIWVMPFDGGSEGASPLLSTPANEYMPAVSPDGRWMTYLSDATGKWEVHLRSTSGEGGEWQVSSSGGGEPFWSSDGKVVYFGNKDGLAAVTVSFEPGLALGPVVDFPWNAGIAKADRLLAGDEFIAIRELADRPKIDAVRVVVNPD